MTAATGDAGGNVGVEYLSFGLSADEAINLATAFRPWGFWRMDLDTGHVFASPGFFRIYGLPCQNGPIDIVSVSARIHPTDLVELMHVFENAGSSKRHYQCIFRVRMDAENHKYLRTIGQFREKPGTSGEIVGMTYELFDAPPDALLSERESKEDGL